MYRFLLFLLLISSSSRIFSQKGFHTGVSGTFNSTWIIDQNNTGTLRAFKDPAVRISEMAYKKTWGGNGGIVLGYNFHKSWGIQAELQYNFTGQLYRDSFMGPVTIPEGTYGAGGKRVDVQRDIYLQYLQVPLLIKYMSKGKTIKFFAGLGPQFGFRMAAAEEVRIAGHVYLPDSLAFSAKEKFRFFDAGVALQSGIQVYPVRFLYIDLGVSVYYGFTDINGKVMKNPDWYKEKGYHASRNFRAGMMLGVHFLFLKQKQAFSPSKEKVKKPDS